MDLEFNMDISKATDYLFLLTNSSKIKTYPKYFLNIESLDLKSNVVPKLKSKVRRVSRKRSSFKNCLKLNKPFKEENYEDFINGSLEQFMEQFKVRLYHLLRDTPTKNLVHDKEFYDLLETKPNHRSEEVLRRYLLAHIKTERSITDDKTIELFENVSNILYKWKHTNSLLSVLLLNAASYARFVFPSTLYEIKPIEKLDYILHHLQSYCNENLYQHGFHKYKQMNSVNPWLCSGSHDGLRIMLKYGFWKVYIDEEIQDLMWSLFGIRTSGISPENFDLLSYFQHQEYRLLLILQMYRCFTVPIQDRNQYLSTIQLHWRSILCPYLVAEEMYFVLLRIVPLEKHEEVRRVCEMYGEILCPRKVEPRSLKHHARCAIRFWLDAVCLLPHGIDCLKLPQAMCSYLRLER